MGGRNNIPNLFLAVGVGGGGELLLEKETARVSISRCIVDFDGCCYSSMCKVNYSVGRST